MFLKKKKKKKFVLAQGLLGNYLLHVMPDVPCWPREQFGLMALLWTGWDTIGFSNALQEIAEAVTLNRFTLDL